MRLWRLAALLILALLVGWFQVRKADTKRRIEEQILEFSKLNWVCYAPTNYSPRRGVYPTPESVRTDLQLLKASGFDGIVTYECAGPLEPVADLAQELGLKVIQGVWGPADREELEHAIRKKDKVVAYCVGNEGLGTRYTIGELDEGLTYLSNRTGVPAAISEQIHLYFEHPALIDIGDWLFPIVHPHFGNAKSLEGAVGWVNANTRRLRRAAAARGRQKILFTKEVGMPSAGDPAYSESAQARFLESMLEQRELLFAVFEAFDRKGWEHVSPVEPYWGVFRDDRSPKVIARRMRETLARRKALSGALRDVSLEAK
jgi:exo-beta-1,3-glucanase (GH17 family)